MPKKKRSDQQGLFAAAIFDPANLKLRARVLSLEDVLEPDEKVRGSAPFRKSIEEYGGIFEPIVVQWDEKRKKFKVVEGRRRYFAVSDLVGEEKLPGKTKLPASEIIGLPLDFPDEVIQACVSLLLNHLRGDNIVADAANMDVLMKAGATEHDLKRFAGLNDQSVKRLVKITKLIKPLKDGMTEGHIAPGVAERISKMPQPQQEKLADILRGRLKGKRDEERAAVRITDDDVRSVKSVLTAQTVEALPQSLFDELEGLDEDTSNPMQFHIDQLRRLEATLPTTASASTRTQFTKLIEHLEKHYAPKGEAVKA